MTEFLVLFINWGIKRMKSVLKFFFISMIVFLPQIVLGQTKNVTNLVKPFNSDNEIKIKGATLDD